MKILKSVLLFTFLLIFVVSCKDDDVNDNDDLVSIIGSWEFVSSTTDGVINPSDDCLLEYIFYDPDLLIINDFYGVSCIQSDRLIFRYFRDGNQLKMGFQGHIEEHTFEISKLTDTILEITNRNNNEVYIETFKRL